jgi:hypothetical protein
MTAAVHPQATTWPEQVHGHRQATTVPLLHGDKIVNVLVTM